MTKSGERIEAVPAAVGRRRARFACVIVFASLGLGCGGPDVTATPASAERNPQTADPPRGPGEAAAADPVDSPREPGAGVSAHPVDPAPDAILAPWFGMPRYPRARELCSQHVTANTMHIVWTGYATADSPATVRAFFDAHLGGATLSDDGAGAFSLRPAGDTAHVVSVGPADGPHPTCEVAHAPTDRTYIVVSTATGG